MANPPFINDAVDIKSSLAQYWDERSATFDAQPQHVSQSESETAAWKDILCGLTRGGKALSILDVGTGTGFLACLLAEMGHRVVGIDIATEMLMQARAKATRAATAELNPLGSSRRYPQDVSPLFQEMDAEHTSFPDETFDVVVNRHVIWNLPHPEMAIKEWTRITKPGGSVGVINGVFSSRKNRWEEPYRSTFERLPLAEGVAPEVLGGLMELGGLTDIRIEWLNALAEIKGRTVPAEVGYAPNRRYLVAGTKVA